MVKIVNIDKKWSEPIGDFFVSFAGIEMKVIECILFMSRDPIRKHVSRLNFSNRISLLIDLLSQHTNAIDAAAKLREDMIAAKELSNKRNIIAHNPLVFFMHNHASGDLNMRECIMDILNEQKIIEFDELIDLVERTETLEASISKHMTELRTRHFNEIGYNGANA